MEKLGQNSWEKTSETSRHESENTQQLGKSAMVATARNEKPDNVVETEADENSFRENIRNYCAIKEDFDLNQVKNGIDLIRNINIGNIKPNGPVECEVYGVTNGKVLDFWIGQSNSNSEQSDFMSMDVRFYAYISDSKWNKLPETYETVKNEISEDLKDDLYLFLRDKVDYVTESWSEYDSDYDEWEEHNEFLNKGSLFPWGNNRDDMPTSSSECKKFKTEVSRAIRTFKDIIPEKRLSEIEETENEILINAAKAE